MGGAVTALHQIWVERAEDKAMLNFNGTEPVWHTLDGKKIPLSQIEDGHLQNIERFLRGKGKLRVNTESPRIPHWQSVILGEMVRRGLDALDGVES